MPQPSLEQLKGMTNEQLMKLIIQLTQLDESKLEHIGFEAILHPCLETCSLLVALQQDGLRKRRR